MQTLAQVKKDILDSGFSEIQEGVYLTSKATLIEEQKSWDAYDEAKNYDFSSHDFWITTDNGIKPLGFDYIVEALEELK